MRDKPLIAVITPGTHLIPSGSSTSVERVVHEVTRRLTSEAEVIVFGKYDAGRAVKEDVGGIRYIRPKPDNRRTYLQTIYPWLRSLRPDIIQVENRPKFAAAIKRQFPRARVWLSLHSTTFIEPPALSARLRRGCLRRPDRIIVNSAFLRRRLLAQTAGMKAGMKARLKVHTVYPGVEADVFRSRFDPGMAEQIAREKQEAGYAGKKLVIYAGRLIPIKGPHHVLHIWPTIVRKHPDAVLLLIGGARYGKNAMTPYVKRLQALAGRARGHVRFVPFVPYEDMPRWYRMADIAVVPSARREAFGLVNVEAMSCGVPVVATASGGIKEVVKHGVTGYLAPVQHPRKQLLAYIDKLLADEPLRESMGRNAMERARSLFNWERAAERYGELYRRYRG